MTHRFQSKHTDLTRQSLLIATHNKGKLLEFKRVLSEFQVRLFGLKDVGMTTEVEESGMTFAENATIKAQYYFRQTGLRTLADDSGLEVEALGGAPGVRSARYGGPQATDQMRISLLLDTLRATGDTMRRARFVCVLALIDAAYGDDVHLFSAACPGRIASEPHGANGFGYDPIFIPEGYTKTFAELPAEIKNSISHRGRALNLLLKHFRESTQSSRT